MLGGEAIGDSDYVDRGHQRLEDWLAFTAASGAPHEYNSPTYMAVDLARLAVLAEETEDPDIALKARIGEELLWLHVAAHYHPRPRAARRPALSFVLRRVDGRGRLPEAHAVAAAGR